MSFPDKFVWGAAAASYQVEGGAFADGKGLSVWDMMCRWNGKVSGGETGNTACDHYHRYQEDVAMMAEIGLQAYRLSVSWPRVLPDGVGKVNQQGLDFYERLVDALLAAGIAPWITLFHWDYPYELFKRGGWLNPASSDWFAEYAALLAEKLGDRVRHWMTQNEPQCYLHLGHATGVHAPGLQLDFPEILLATHNSLLAHGKAVQALRAGCKGRVMIGAAPVGIVNYPATDSAADIAVARKSMFSVKGKDLWSNTWLTDPMMFGSYPADGLEMFAAELPPIGKDDLCTICQPLDFFGFNNYNGTPVRAAANAAGWEAVPFKEGYPLTAMEWPVTPEALYWGPKFFYERYKLPIVITENGMANCDWVHADGRVHDPQRIDFLQRYLSAYQRAIADGVDGIGYFQWSIMDNFEWSFGYKRRFGLIHVDYETGKRTLKDSACWYKNIIAGNGAGLGEES